MTDGKRALSVEEFLSKWALHWGTSIDTQANRKNQDEMRADLEEMLKQARGIPPMLVRHEDGSIAVAPESSLAKDGCGHPRTNQGYKKAP